MMAGLQWFASKTIGQAMKRSEKLIESIDGIVWEADPVTFQFTFVSRAGRADARLPVREWLSEHGFWEDHIHPDDRDARHRLVPGLDRQLPAHEFEYRMIAADGRHVWIRDIVTVEAEAGRAKTLRGIMMDVTARKTAEDPAARVGGALPHAGGDRHRRDHHHRSARAGFCLPMRRWSGCSATTVRR